MRHKVPHKSLWQRRNGAVPLKRTSSEPYHYSYSANKIQTNPKRAEFRTPTDQQHTNATGESCTCQPRFAPQLQEIDFLRTTGKKLRSWISDRSWISAETKRNKVYLFHVRTSSNYEDDEAMDMTIKDGVKMSNLDIRARKIGSKVTAQMKADLLTSTKSTLARTVSSPRKTVHRES
jgi:hypothetical protein